MKALRILIWLIILAILVGLVGFTVQNPSENVRVRLFRYTFSEVPLVVSLFVALVVGMVMTLVFGLYFMVEQSVTTRRLRGEIRALERELAALRNLAVEDASPPREEELRMGPDEGLSSSSEIRP